jgi:hypothetical protein
MENETGYIQSFSEVSHPYQIKAIGWGLLWQDVRKDNAYRCWSFLHYESEDKARKAFEELRPEYKGVALVEIKSDKQIEIHDFI